MAIITDELRVCPGCGLPPAIEDPAVIDNVAALLLVNDERPVPTGRIAELKEATRVRPTVDVRT